MPARGRWRRRAGFRGIWRGCGRCRGSAPTPAAAVGAIAFDVPAVPVDGNVERVTARLFALTRRCPAAKPAIRAAADRLGADPDAMARPCDFAQALFDLGATVCTPASPAVRVCPGWRACGGAPAGIAARVAAPGAEEAAAAAARGAFLAGGSRPGNVLLRRRPEAGCWVA